jgi:hypothetical protein
MASTYSDRLKLEIMATGANANTWGTNTNNNLEVIDAFAAGYLSKSVAGSANITLTTANASDTAESSNKTLELTGALTGDIVVFIPAVESEYNFFNNTSGSQTLTIAATGHTANGIAIAQGAKTTVFCDGASNYNVEIISSTDAGALGSGTLPDARFPATLPATSGANLTALNASNLGSGTVPDARFPATLPAASGVNLTALNATNLASGTVADARLGTVSVSKGGTGLTAVGTAGQVLTTNSGADGLEYTTIVGGGGYNMQVFTNPGTYTPTSGMKNVKVTVVGGGGGTPGAQDGTSGSQKSGGGAGGGLAMEEISAASVGNSQPVTVGSGGSGGNNGQNNFGNGNAGGTSSFGSFLSATGGAVGTNSQSTTNPAAAGGAGSGGDYNGNGQPAMGQNLKDGGSAANGFGFGGFFEPNLSFKGNNGTGFGGGGGGTQSSNTTDPLGGSSGAGSAGVVIVEEYL